MKNKMLSTISEWIALTVGIFLVALAVSVFMIPSEFLVGSISALSLVLSNYIPLSVSVITAILNVALLIVGFIFIGHEFGLKTVYTSVLLPVFLWLFEQYCHCDESIMGDVFLDLLCYMFIVSIGQAILFYCNASSGGLDIAAKFLNKFLHIELGAALAILGTCIALSGGLIFDLKTVILSVLGTFLNGVILDQFIFGLNLKRRVCIISDKENEIKQYIIHELHSGATVYESTGGVSGETQREIITIVDKNNYMKLMKHIEKVTTHAFVTVYDVKKIIYRNTM